MWLSLTHFRRESSLTRHTRTHQLASQWMARLLLSAATGQHRSAHAYLHADTRARSSLRHAYTHAAYAVIFTVYIGYPLGLQRGSQWMHAARSLTANCRLWNSSRTHTTHTHTHTRTRANGLISYSDMIMRMWTPVHIPSHTHAYTS